jgi:uncharacterized protein YdeI (YjbR/CyaY-like superfamily)
LLGFYHTGSGKTGITYFEALDEALCFGWIDGIRKNFDSSSYTIRFTPRRPRSIWSAINIKRVESLTERGLMRPAGVAAFEKRSKARSGIYSFEQREPNLGTVYRKKFVANKEAWTFFRSQAPSFQRDATWWVMSAKKEETRIKRLDELIAHSSKGSRPPRFAPWVANKPRSK